VHSAPNLVRLFSFVFPFPSLTFFHLNNNALSKHGGRIASCFSFCLLAYIHVRACSFRFLFICISVLYLVALGFAYRIPYRDGEDWLEITPNDAFVR